jgi:hypothetical protein
MSCTRRSRWAALSAAGGRRQAAGGRRQAAGGRRQAHCLPQDGRTGPAQCRSACGRAFAGRGPSQRHENAALPRCSGASSQPRSRAPPPAPAPPPRPPQALEIALRQAESRAAERGRTLLQAQESISELQVRPRLGAAGRAPVYAPPWRGAARRALTRSTAARAVPRSPDPPFAAPRALCPRLRPTRPRRTACAPRCPRQRRRATRRSGSWKRRCASGTRCCQRACSRPAPSRASSGRARRCRRRPRRRWCRPRRR